MAPASGSDGGWAVMAILFTITCCFLLGLIAYFFCQLGRLQEGSAEVILAHEIVEMKRVREVEREEAKDQLLRVMVERLPLLNRRCQPLDYRLWDCELRRLMDCGLDLTTDNPHFRDLLEQVRKDAALIEGRGRNEQDHCKECLAYLDGIWLANSLDANTAEALAPSRRPERL